MTEPQDDFAEAQAAAELLTRAFCTHPDRVDVSTQADADRALFCPACGEQWTERRTA